MSPLQHPEDVNGLAATLGPAPDCHSIHCIGNSNGTLDERPSVLRRAWVCASRRHTSNISRIETFYFEVFRKISAPGKKIVTLCELEKDITGSSCIVHVSTGSGPHERSCIIPCPSRSLGSWSPDTLLPQCGIQASSTSRSASLHGKRGKLAPSWPREVVLSCPCLSRQSPIATTLTLLIR